MFRKVTAIAIGLGLIIPGLQATSIRDLDKKIIEAKKTEIEKTGVLNLRGLGLDSMQGIEQFEGEGVKVLNLSGNNFKKIDMTKYVDTFPGLKKLVAKDNPELGWNIHRNVDQQENLQVVLLGPVGRAQEWARHNKEAAAGIGLAATAATATTIGFGFWLGKKYSLMDRIRYRFFGQTLPEERRTEIVYELTQTAEELAEEDVSKAEFEEFEKRYEEKLRATFGFANFELIARDILNVLMQERKLDKYLAVDTD